MSRNTTLNTLAAFAALLMLSACSEETSTVDRVRNEGQNLSGEGKFMAQLAPLNSAVAGMTTGKVSVAVDRDSIDVLVTVRDAHPFTDHAQAIYLADRCPTAQDDLNADGFIDPVEAEKVLGKALLPLDADISAQEIGLGEFPRSNSIGQYEYVQAASFSKLIADLRAPDLDPKDDLVKLAPRTNFSFAQKIVAVQGVEADVYVPATVDAGPGRSVRSSLLIACGKLEARTEDEL